MIVILGGGLAGLATALHLGDLPWTLYEAEEEVGGLCRSDTREGFTFDYTGHLLYLHHDPVKVLLREGFRGKVHALRRSAWIRHSGVEIPFPFQVNTCGLPPEVRVECLLGFVEALAAARLRPPRVAPEPCPNALDRLERKVMDGAGDDTVPDFETWVRETFGAGFMRHFFRPYNEKLWRRSLSEMTADWVSWSVPVPELEEVLRGALGLERKRFGYNTDIFYPLEGGIRLVPDLLARALGPEAPVRCGRRAVAVEAAARRVHFQDGTEREYTWLVATLPLDRLAAMTKDAPPEVHCAAGALEAVTVFGVNLGIRGAFGHDRHWTYFPEEDYLFYRVGFISNYAPAMAPEGCCSLTAEVARRPDEPPVEDLEGRVVGDLVRAGVIRRSADVVFTNTIRIDPAYVVFDEARRRALPVLFEYFLRHRILPVGRYGSWEYLGMEDAILQGMRAAAALRGEAAAGGGGGT